MKKSTILTSILFLSTIIMVCPSCGSSGNNAKQEETKTQEETINYSINTKKEWISHVTNANSIKMIDDGFLSMSSEKIVSILLELTEELSGYGYMVNEYGTIYADMKEAKGQCLAWNYLLQGYILHEDRFTSQQRKKIDDISPVSSSLAILASAHVLGRDAVSDMSDAYSRYVSSK